MRIWGIHKKYKSLSWWENFMGGHISIGNLTIFGENAMRWQINYRTKRWGVVCLKLPFRTFGHFHGAHFYCSPNGTPWASTYYKQLIGNNRWEKEEEIRARIRKFNFGHNFDTNRYSKELYTLNNRFDGLMITEYHMMKYGRMPEED